MAIDVQEFLDLFEESNIESLLFFQKSIVKDAWKMRCAPSSNSVEVIQTFIVPLIITLVMRLDVLRDTMTLAQSRAHTQGEKDSVNFLIGQRPKSQQ